MTRLPAGSILLAAALVSLVFAACLADIGTAAFYSRPYVPTACYGTSVVQIPANNLFAAVDDRIWDNGTACGREYSLRCLSGKTPPNPCVAGKTVKVRVVDHAPLKFLVPLIYAPILALIKKALGNYPVVQDRLSMAILAGGFVHGLYLAGNGWA